MAALSVLHEDGVTVSHDVTAPARSTAADDITTPEKPATTDDVTAPPAASQCGPLDQFTEPSGWTKGSDTGYVNNLSGLYVRFYVIPDAGSSPSLVGGADPGDLKTTDGNDGLWFVTGVVGGVETVLPLSSGLCYWAHGLAEIFIGILPPANK